MNNIDDLRKAVQALGYAPRLIGGRLKFVKGNIQKSAKELVPLIPRGEQQRQVVEAWLGELANDVVPDPEEEGEDGDGNRAISDIVLDALSSGDLDIVPRGPDYYSHSGFLWPVESVVFKIRDWIRTHTKKANVGKVDVLDALAEISTVLRKREYANLKATLSYDPSVTFPMEDLLIAICGDNPDPMYEKVIRAKIWSIKRSIWGMEKWNPFLLNFYGRENTGKNVLIKAMFQNVLGTSIVGEVANVAESINDTRFGKMFVDNAVVIMPELAAAEKANVGMIKGLIDREMVDIRIMCSTRFEKCRIRADMVSSSNDNLRDIFLADHSVRKWAEIPLLYRNDTRAVMNEVTIPLLGDPTHNIQPKFNMVDLWRSVDENGECPLRDIYTEFQEWTTKRCLFMSKVNVFIRDHWKERTTNHSLVTASGESIYKEYSAYVNGDKVMAIRKFYERLELFGFRVENPNAGHAAKMFVYPNTLRNMEV